MANTSLPNLTERTATANTDLIHVNSGGTDYKETKANFLSDVNSSITSLNNSLTNTLGKFPQNISSFSEFDALATSGGFHTFRTSASFTCGNGTMPNYGRGLIMNYTSTDSSFILCSPTGFVFGFKNSGNWNLKQLSF